MLLLFFFVLGENGVIEILGLDLCYYVVQGDGLRYFAKYTSCETA